MSANPTGPLLVSHGRGAIFGDAVARLLEATGNRVTREYYINDFGNQVRLFASSVRALGEGRDVPEDGYRGAYVVELAKYLQKTDEWVFAQDDETLARTCVTWMLRGIPGSRDLPGIKTTLRDLGVEFDVWFSEESLHRWGNVGVALRQLESDGYLAKKKGRGTPSSSKRRTPAPTTKTASSGSPTASTRTLLPISRTSPTRFHADTSG